METDSNQRLYLLFTFPRTAANNFNVNFTIAQRQNDNFLVNTTPAQSFNPSTLTTTNVFQRKSESGDTLYMTYSFQITGDATDEDHGIITITLQDGGTNYSLSGTVSQRSTIVNVIDDDGTSPSVGFEGVSTSNVIDAQTRNFSYTANVTEGGDSGTTEIFFVFTTQLHVTPNFIIKYQLVESPSNNFLAGATNNTVDGRLNLSTAGTAIQSQFGATRYFLSSFEITNDDVSESGTTITFTLLNGDGYTRITNNDAHLATINVSDDDTIPLTLVGAGGEEAFDETKFGKSYSVKEPATGRTRIYFLIHFPTITDLNFDIKYRVTQGANEDFIVGTTTADRTLNPSSTTSPSHGNEASADMTKIYTIGSFEIQNDSTRNIGSITLTLKTGTGYTLSTTPADNSITIDIDAPLLNLVGAGGELAVDETKFSTTYSVSEPASGHNQSIFFDPFSDDN